MNRKILCLASLTTVLFSLASCLGNDSTDITTYDDTAITAFSIGKVKRHQTTSKGKDTTVVYDASTTKFYIDQLRHEIYNVDSLPVGVDASKILTKLSTKHSGTAVYQNLKDTTWLYFSTTDSIDYSKPRRFRVYSSSGSSYQDYTVKVNVHQEEADKFVWASATTTLPILAQMTGLKAIQQGSRIYVFGTVGNTIHVVAGEQSAPTSFTEVSLSTPLSTEAAQNMVVLNDTVYTLSDGKLLGSTQISNGFYTLASTPNLRQLLGTDRQQIYALTNSNTIVSSKDKGQTWVEATRDADASYLPQTQISFACMPLTTNTNMDRLLLTGKNTMVSNGRVAWNKVVDYKTDTRPWSYIETTDGNRYQQPSTTDFRMVAYNGHLEGFDGEKLYNSYDFGLTWHAEEGISMPQGFNGNTANFYIFTDNKGFLWLVVHGTLWRGRHNSIGWQYR